ncbi:DUF5707 domain-containing protein [Streptomyces sp. NPDC058678]|uniref:DUF5707 domain-containing protein n=1 Tax=Streptomyces sp. NPDC058678 TaxID=3346595 RepID=UPI003657D4E6
MKPIAKLAPTSCSGLRLSQVQVPPPPAAVLRVGRSHRACRAASMGTTAQVPAWPATSPFAKKGLTVKDLAAVDSAVCKPSGEDTVRCTCAFTVTRADAEASPRGLWHVAVLATAEDGDTTLDTNAADFTVA